MSALVLALAFAARGALADVLPPPTRPAWDEHPAPLPLPPEAIVALAVALFAVGAWWSRRGRAR